MKRKLTAALLALVCLAGLFACKKNDAPPRYATADVQAVADAGAFSEPLEEVDGDTAFALYRLSDYGFSREELTDCAVLRSAGATCEECAVLVFDENAAALDKAEGALKDYLDSQIKANRDYRPAEVPKLEGATVSRRENTFLLLVADKPELAKEAVGVKSASSGALSAAPVVSAVQSTDSTTSDPYALYVEVLQGKSEFYDVMSGKYTDIAHLKDAFTTEDYPFAIGQFAAMDLDGDGRKEIVLALSLAENNQAGFEILREQDGSIYGYYLAYRAFSELKADGSFTFSSGAADWGFGKLSFTVEGCETDEISYCASGEFVVDGEAATEEKFLAAARKQEVKETAVWCEFAGNDFSVLR